MSLQNKWLAPLIFFQLYLSFSIILYAFGPWPWENPNQNLTIGYLLAAQLFICFGYLLSWKKVRKENLLVGVNPNLYSYKALKFIKFSLFINYAVFVPSSLSRTGGFFPDLLLGLTNTGLAYNSNLERLDHGNPYVIFEYIRIILSPWIIGIFPVAVVYWRQISPLLRCLSFGAFCLNIFLYIGTGTNKGLADFVITIPWLIFLGVSVGYLSVRFRPRLFLIFGFFLIGFLSFFGAGQIQRQGNAGIAGAFNSGDGIIYADRDHLVSTLLPEILVIIYESMARYITQGYYALSLTFDIESPTTFGFGNSMFLSRNADALMKTDYFTTQSLPSLLEESAGWSMTGLWHSIYPWLASDFGFLGTLFVMGILGYLMGISWGLSLVAPRPITIIVFYLLLVLFYYIPANNQILQSGESAAALLFCCVYVFISKILLYKSTYYLKS